MRPALIAMLVLSGCVADDPPVIADHASAAYRADLEACRDEGADVADKDVKKRGPYFMTYPVSFVVLHSRETRRCLERRGYRLPEY